MISTHQSLLESLAFGECLLRASVLPYRLLPRYPIMASYPTTHDKITDIVDTQWFIDNEFKASESTESIELHDPATNNLVTRVPQSTEAEMIAAVDSAERAFPAWKATSVLHRQRLMFRLVALIRENWDRLAANITLEQGKTFADARGDVLRGLQVAEASCAAPELLKGEVLEVATDMETRTYKEPLGVVAAICPFSKLLHWKPIRLNQAWLC